MNSHMKAFLISLTAYCLVAFTEEPDSESTDDVDVLQPAEEVEELATAARVGSLEDKVEGQIKRVTELIELINTIHVEELGDDSPFEHAPEAIADTGAPFEKDSAEDGPQ